MKTGYWISGLGHGSLIFWLLFGGFFLPEDPPEFEMTEVGFISEADFERMQDLASAAEAAPEVSAVPVPRPAPAPEPEPTPEPVPEPTPEPIPEPAPEPTPEPISEPPAPEPDPVPAGPEQPVETPAEIPADTTVVPEANEIIAPTAVAEPEPDVEVAEEVTEEVTETPEAAEVVEQVTPTEATTVETGGEDIVPEQVDPPASAPVTSLVPQLRPARPAPAPEPATETRPEPVQTAQADTTDPLAEVINNAVASANETPSEPAGPPLSFGERDGLRQQIHQCWNTGAISSAAAQVTITVHFSLDRDGNITSRPELADWEGGSREAANIAFRAANSAISRCQNRGNRRGYDMPAEKYGHWRDIEAVFSGSGMIR
ncbi:MAG: hypothetical protein ACPGUX_08370 [Halocynthiibacter sp.]